MVRQRTTTEEEEQAEEARETAKRQAERARITKPVERWEVEEKFKGFEESFKRLDKEVVRAQDLTKSVTNLAQSISQDYSRLVHNKELEISECVLKCRDFSKQVSELQ